MSLLLLFLGSGAGATTGAGAAAGVGTASGVGGSDAVGVGSASGAGAAAGALLSDAVGVGSASGAGAASGVPHFDINPNLGLATVFGFPGLSSNFTLSGGSWDSAYPETNLFNDDLRRVARTIDATTGSTVIKGNCSTAELVGVMALASNTMSLLATIRLRLYSDNAWTTMIYDSGAVTPWPSGKIIDPDWFWLADAGVNYSIQSFQIDIDDSGNAAGYVDIGYLEIATAAIAPFQFVPQAQRGRLLRSTNSQIPGGRKIFRRRASGRSLVATYQADDNDMQSLYLEMFRQNDLDVPFVVIPHPDDQVHWNQNAMLCRFVDTGPVSSYTDFQRNQTTLKLEQVL